MGFGEMNPPNGTNILGPCCADHLEDMMFPTSTWGKEFAIARSQSRGTNELDVLRIMAQKPNTTVTITPAPVGTCPTLNAGQHCQIKISADTSIIASEPVLIGHYLQSAIWQDPIFGGALGSGDPSMALAVPTEQYRTIRCWCRRLLEELPIDLRDGGRRCVVDGLRSPYARHVSRRAHAGQRRPARDLVPERMRRRGLRLLRRGLVAGRGRARSQEIVLE
jgi:hypothetical protein